jgi:hypothetical protein
MQLDPARGSGFDEPIRCSGSKNKSTCEVVSDFVRVFPSGGKARAKLLSERAFVPRSSVARRRRAAVGSGNFAGSARYDASENGNLLTV